MWIHKIGRNENNYFQKEKTGIDNERGQESYEKAKYFNICKEKFENKYLKDKKYRKVTDQCHYTEEVLRIAYVIWNIVRLKKFLWVFIMDQTMMIILS